MDVLPQIHRAIAVRRALGIHAQVDQADHQVAFAQAVNRFLRTGVQIAERLEVDFFDQARVDFRRGLRRLHPEEADLHAALFHDSRRG